MNDIVQHLANTWSLSLGGLLIIIGLFWAIQRLRLRVHLAEQRITVLSELLQGIKSVETGQGRAVRRLHRRVSAVQSSQQSQVLSAHSAEKSYAQATKMLNMGIPAEEIRECCRLTTGEIELLAQMQQASSAELH